MTFDGRAFGQEIVAAVKDHLVSALEPLLRRLDALERQLPEKGEKGEKGDPGERGADGSDGGAGPPGPPGEPGKKGDKGDRGEPGADGRDGTPGERGPPGERGEKGEKGDPGQRGADGLPGKDGVNGERGEQGPKGERGDAGPPGPEGPSGRDGKDGVGLAGALIDRTGSLVLTLSNGTTRELGQVVGRDGAPGQKGADGRDGKDGADGFGFGDLEVIHDGFRSFSFRFAKGDRVKDFTFSLPAMIYRGVFREGGDYQRGDTVTLGGSLWHCEEETSERPGEGQKAWTLAAKRGRDGKDAPIKPEKAAAPLRIG